MQYICPQKGTAKIIIFKIQARKELAEYLKIYAKVYVCNKPAADTNDAIAADTFDQIRNKKNVKMQKKCKSSTHNTQAH